MACWVCGAADLGTECLSLTSWKNFFFVPHSCVVGNPVATARADLSERSSSPCLGFALRHFEFLILVFVLFHSFQFVLHSNHFLVSLTHVRLAPGSCFLSCLLAWSVTFEVAHSSWLSDITSAVSLCGVFRCFLILVRCPTGFATFI